MKLNENENENVSARYLIRSEVVVTTEVLIDEQEAVHQFFEQVWSGWEDDRSELQIESLRVTSVVELPDDPDGYVHYEMVQAVEQVAAAWGQLQDLEHTESSTAK